MHLSISSSESLKQAASPRMPFSSRHAATPSTPAERVPAGVGRAWLIALVIVVGVLAAVECTCRKLGMRSTLQDDQQLWCSVRDSMRAGDRNQIAPVGSSPHSSGFRSSHVFAVHGRRPGDATGYRGL